MLIIYQVFGQDRANISAILREMLAGQRVTDPAQVARLLQPLNHQSFNADFFQSPQLASDRKKFIKILRQWVRQSTIADCQKFVRVMTGSEYLPAGGGRSIDVSVLVFYFIIKLTSFLQVVFYPSGFSSSTFNDVVRLRLIAFLVSVLMQYFIGNGYTYV